MIYREERHTLFVRSTSNPPVHGCIVFIYVKSVKYMPEIGK